MKTLFALATLKIVASIFYLRQRIRQRQDNERQRQDNEIFSKNPVFMRFLEVTRQQDNEIAFQTIYLYILLLYIPYFSLFYSLCVYYFYFFRRYRKMLSLLSYNAIKH